MRLIPPPRTPAVFAVASDAVQVTFRAGARQITVEAESGDEPPRLIELSDRPGAVTVAGLSPSSAYRVSVVGSRTARLRTRTLRRPRGAVVARIATMNDTHFGLDDFGLSGRIREPGSARRCATAALIAAERWGADHIVLKGDLTKEARAHEWDDLKSALATVGVPAHLMLGNHESAEGRLADSLRALDAIAAFERRPLARLDANGFAVFLADTTVVDGHHGDLRPFGDELIEQLSGSGPALVLHHHQMSPVLNTYPRGIHGPAVNRFFRSVAEANPDTVFASGHTHRHRRTSRAGLTVTELGATKDYPGTWCAYTVYEGGIEATVYRVDDEAAVAWLDRTGAAVAGVWARWSPGRLGDRCWTKDWLAPLQ